MRLLPTAVVIVSFLCVGHTAPTISCDSLTQKIPIEITDKLLGKWMFVSETINMPGVRGVTKKYVESAIINITRHPDRDTLSFFQSQRMFDNCVSISSTSVVTNNSLQMTTPYKATENLLTTSCPDCLIIQGNFTLGSNYYQSLQLLSRRRILSTAEQDEFKKQAECLNLPPPIFIDPEKELCSVDQATSSTDITSVLNSEMATQIFGMIESAINSKGGLEGFMDLVNNVPTAKQH